MSTDLSQSQVEAAVRKFGVYRTKRCQTVALQGRPDGISGADLIALGLRETGLRNVNGGARWDASSGTWVATKDDHGVFQIATKYHAADLKRMPGVAEGTWAPIVNGKTAFNDGYCPRFEDSLQFTLREMHEAQAVAVDEGLADEEHGYVLGRFAIVAHNAGIGGALDGFKEGEPDRYTAQHNYSQWVEDHARKIKRFLNANPRWKV